MRKLNISVMGLSFLVSAVCFGEKAFTIGGVATTVKQIAEQEKAEFFEIEKKRYQLIERLARRAYLEHFWKERAKKSKKSVEQEKADYLKENVKISEESIKTTLERFKEHSELSKLPAEQRREEIKNFLQGQEERAVLEGIINAALKDRKLVINYPKPVEPRFEFTIGKNEPVRYGPKDSDIKPIKCKGDECITIVEYSEFQCPFCSRVIPATRQVMETYKGKVRWVVRDFPLSFHDRAKPAAVAARCALRQGKYWQMYSLLFKNQKKLEDKDFVSYAGQIDKLDKGKWQECINKPDDELAQIQKNFQSGVKVGVTGTPAFFVNGRRLSGAVPFETFKDIIDEELSSQKKI